MGSDCTVGIDDGFLNIRVGAIIMRGKQFLMAGSEELDYLYSVGGRIQFGETAEEAVRREVLEETGTEMEIDRLGFIQENYYYGDFGKYKDKLIYEIDYYFYMKVPEDFQPVCNSTTGENFKEKLVWVDADTETLFYPEFFREELKHPVSYVKYRLNDER